MVKTKTKNKTRKCKYCGTRLIEINRTRKNILFCEQCPAIFDK